MVGGIETMYSMIGNVNADNISESYKYRKKLTNQLKAEHRPLLETLKNLFSVVRTQGHLIWQIKR